MCVRIRWLRAIINLFQFRPRWNNRNTKIPSKPLYLCYRYRNFFIRAAKKNSFFLFVFRRLVKYLLAKARVPSHHGHLGPYKILSIRVNLFATFATIENEIRTVPYSATYLEGEHDTTPFEMSEIYLQSGTVIYNECDRKRCPKKSTAQISLRWTMTTHSDPNLKTRWTIAKRNFSETLATYSRAVED